MNKIQLARIIRLKSYSEVYNLTEKEATIIVQDDVFENGSVYMMDNDGVTPNDETED